MMLILIYQKRLKLRWKQTIIKISGVDKELVSKVAADIKNLKPVEPYKAKELKKRVNTF